MTLISRKVGLYFRHFLLVVDYDIFFTWIFCEWRLLDLNWGVMDLEPPSWVERTDFVNNGSRRIWAYVKLSSTRINIFRSFLFQPPTFLFHHLNFLFCHSIETSVFINRNFFLPWNTILVFRNRNFMKFKLKKFQFMRIEFFIKGKIKFFMVKNEKQGLREKTFYN
jgi:hypothetical protein